MSERPGKNPYRPGAATSPLHLAGRDPQIGRFKKILDGAPELPANLRLTGLRGVGKSVLLKELERAAQSRNWAVARHQLEPRHNTENELRNLIVALAGAAERRMSRTRSLKGKVTDAWTTGRGLLNVTVEDITFSLAGANNLETQLAEVLFETVEAAIKSAVI